MNFTISPTKPVELLSEPLFKKALKRMHDAYVVTSCFFKSLVLIPQLRFADDTLSQLKFGIQRLDLVRGGLALLEIPGAFCKVGKKSKLDCNLCIETARLFMVLSITATTFIESCVNSLLIKKGLKTSQFVQSFFKLFKTLEEFINFKKESIQKIEFGQNELDIDELHSVHQKYLILRSTKYFLKCTQSGLGIYRLFGQRKELRMIMKMTEIVTQFGAVFFGWLARKTRAQLPFRIEISQQV